MSSKLTREFHETFDVPVAKSLGLPSPDVRQLRITLLREEFEEYLEGEEQHDIVEIADALGDMVYVIFGTALSYGIDLDAVITEIHRSNMTKLDADGNVLRHPNGKVKKSDMYQPPDIESALGLE